MSDTDVKPHSETPERKGRVREDFGGRYPSMNLTYGAACLVAGFLWFRVLPPIEARAPALPLFERP